jgi:hypothetical protein
MSDVRLVHYLGIDVNELLRTPPFSGWEVTRTVDEDLPEKEFRYVFEGHGVELNCDQTKRVRAIFLRRGDGESLFNVPFSLKRREVLDRFGVPSESGDAVRIPALGEIGAWDLFALAGASIHFQYRLRRDEIEMITLMRPDAVPR